jgi:VWFA-related protein
MSSPLYRSCCLALLAVAAAGAQQAASEVRFRAETNLMQVEVRVKGRDGKPVAGLLRQDFQLTENGIPQEVATLEYVGGFTTAPQPPNAARRSVDSASGKVRIYIASELAPPSPFCASTAEYELFDRAVRALLGKLWRQGVEVSFNGTPFTADPETLLHTWELMRKHPTGRSEPGKADWLPALVTGGGILQQGLECDDLPTPRLRALARTGMTHQGRVAIERYIDLARKLGVVDGKKVVVLLSYGLMMNRRENAAVVGRLAREALRSRVSFYTVSPVALLAPNSQLASGGPQTRATEGLFAVAENTGGKAIHSTNDFSDVFRQIYSDHSDYYLLGYYPRDRVEKGRFRQVIVSVSKPGVKVATATKGYHETTPFSDLTASEKKDLLQFQALGPERYTSIPVRAGFEFFRGDRGQVVVAYSVAVPAAKMPVKSEKDRVTVELKIAARAEDLNRARMPAVVEQAVQAAMKAEQLEQAHADPVAMFQFPGRMLLSPGKYEWKAVVRDERDGTVGSYQSVIDVPDFAGSLSPSSLLLTNQRIPKRTDDVTGVTAGAHEYVQQPVHVFRRGQTVFAVYDLYGVPEEMLASPPGPRVFLLFGGKPLPQPPFRKYDVAPFVEQQSLSYVAVLETGELETGDYNLIVALPNSESGISRTFTLVAQ